MAERTRQRRIGLTKVARDHATAYARMTATRRAKARKTTAARQTATAEAAVPVVTMELPLIVPDTATPQPPATATHTPVPAPTASPGEVKAQNPHPPTATPLSFADRMATHTHGIALTAAPAQTAAAIARETAVASGKRADREYYCWLEYLIYFCVPWPDHPDVTICMNLNPQNHDGTPPWTEPFVPNAYCAEFDFADRGVPPGVVQTATPVPPPSDQPVPMAASTTAASTATAVPIPVPRTATHTPVPPTATATPVPPTATHTRTVRYK